MVDEIQVYHRWVEPIYMDFVGMPFLKMNEHDQRGWVDAARPLIESIDDATLDWMLHQDNWRYHSTACWFIGLGRHAQHLTAVGECLLTYPLHAYGECFALACLGTSASVYYLVQYLEFYMTDEVAQQWDSEGFIAGFVISALQLVAPLEAKSYYPERWNHFVNLIINFYTQNVLSTNSQSQKNLQRMWSFERNKIFLTAL